jgi:inward rectifier potassium channel
MFRRIRQKSTEFGFGKQAIGRHQRILNKDGSFNIVRIGLPIWEKFNLYHWLTHCSVPVFVLVLITGYFSSNAIFAAIYTYGLGVGHFHGIETHSRFDQFFELFFFSSQTFATVGYGRINPATNLASFVAALDAFTGVMYFAIVTGLIYGRFSKPIAKATFAEKAVEAPYKDGRAFMFRVANKLNHQLLNAEARIIASAIVDLNGRQSREYFELELERKNIVFFATTWTLVHPIDEKSPFYGFSEFEFILSEPEFMVQLKLYDEAYSQETFTNSSYRKEDMVWNALYEHMLSTTDDGRNMINFENFNSIRQLTDSLLTES